jgi:hypothetical protein
MVTSVGGESGRVLIRRETSSATINRSQRPFYACAICLLMALYASWLVP